MKIKFAASALLCCLLLPRQMESQITKDLIVKTIDYQGAVTLDEVSDLLERHTTLNAISTVNWDAFSYQPEVRFRIAYGKNQIWLKYYVQEKYILAQKTETNAAVAGDSCVEFFFDPLGDGNYYNFEFNCIGTPHLSFGPDRHNREFVKPEVIEKHLRIVSTLGNRPFEERTGDYRWEMTIIIPSQLLTFHKGLNLSGRKSRANFNKCGDNTSEKHYLTWNPVKAPKPDYHRPEFFGNLIFE